MQATFTLDRDDVTTIVSEHILRQLLLWNDAEKRSNGRVDKIEFHWPTEEDEHFRIKIKYVKWPIS
jgi:hypothetical protein